MKSLAAERIIRNMSNEKNPDDGPATEPIPTADVRDTALQPSVDFDDDHFPPDTAPLDRDQLAALRSMVEEEQELDGSTGTMDESMSALGGPTDEIDLAGLRDLDSGDPEDTLNDTIKAPAVDRDE